MIHVAFRAIGLSGPAGYVFAGRAFSLAAGVGTAILASRALGPDGRGIVVGVAAVQYLVANGLAFGTGSAGYLLASRREVPPESVAGSVLCIGLVIGAITALITIVAATLGVTDQLFPGLELGILSLVAPAAGSQYVATAMIQLAMGTSRPKAMMVTMAAAPAFLVVATVIVAVAAADPAHMVVAYSIAWVAAAAISIAVISPRARPSPNGARHLIRVGSPAALGDAANALSYRSDVIVLSLLAGPSAVGVYALAVQAMEPLWILAGSAAGGLMMTLPRQPAATWRPAVLSATLRVSIVSAFAALVVVALLPAAVILAGPGFSDTPAVALALAPAIVLLAASKTLSVIPLISGRLWWSSMISVISLGVNIAANIALIPRFGAVGASLGSVTSYAVSAVLWLSAVGRR